MSTDVTEEVGMLMLRRAVAVLVLLVVTAVPLTGCTAATHLTGTWVATDASPNAIVPGSQITLIFEYGRMHGATGCNPIGTTSAEITGGRLLLTGLGTGLSLCSGDLGAQDAWVYTLLGSSPTAQVNGDVLTIEGDLGRLTLHRQ